MRLHTVVLFVLAGLFVPAHMAAQTAPTSPAKTGITFSAGSSSSDLSFRRLLNRQWAALGTLGFTRGTVYGGATPGGATDATMWSIGLAGRRYFAPDALRPFIEAGGGVRAVELPQCDGPRTPFGSAGGGVEYTIAPRVSIEGSAGLTYSSSSQRCTSNGFEYRYENDSFSTFRTSLSITFYF